MSVGAVNKQTGDRIPTAGMPAIDDALDLTSVNPVQNAVITAALANKQDKTDNNLETTSKTVVGAVNELKSGLTNYENQNDLNLEVPDRKNLFNKDNASVITGNALDPRTGVVYHSSAWSVSGYIQIEPSTTYTLTTTPNTSNAVAFYDSEKAYISGESTFGTKETPSNAKYLRFDYKTEAATIMQLELGSTETAYTPYIPSVESRIEAVESGLDGVAITGLILDQNVDGVIDDAKVFRFGKLIVGNIRITLNDAVAASGPLIHGLPRMNTTLAAFSGLCPAVTNKPSVVCVVFNEAVDYASISLANGVSAETGVLMISFTYVSV